MFREITECHHFGIDDVHNVIMFINLAGPRAIEAICNTLQLYTAPLHLDIKVAVQHTTVQAHHNASFMPHDRR